MPKAKTALKRPQKSSNPTASVGLPDMPADYGLKKRKDYLPFSHAEERLGKSRSYWICTARPDGRPHSIPVWGFWMDGQLYFGTGRASRKARNLAHNPAVSIHLESGDDVVILEGTVVEVGPAEKSTLKKIDSASRAKYQMPLMVSPETVLYSVRPQRVLAWTEKDFPNNATRWSFNTKK